MKLASMLQHKTHVHDGDLQESYTLHSLGIHYYLYYLKNSKEDFYSQNSNDPYGNPQPKVHFFGPRGWWAEHNT